MQGHHITSLTKQSTCTDIIKYCHPRNPHTFILFCPCNLDSWGLHDSPKSHSTISALHGRTSRHIITYSSEGDFWRDPLLKSFFFNLFSLLCLSRLGASHAPRILRFGTLEAKKGRASKHAWQIRGDRISDWALGKQHGRAYTYILAFRSDALLGDISVWYFFY